MTLRPIGQALRRAAWFVPLLILLAYLMGYMVRGVWP